MKKTQTITLYECKNGLILDIKFHDRSVQNQSYVFEFELEEKNELYRLKTLLETICYNEHLDKQSLFSNYRIRVIMEELNELKNEWVDVDE